MRSSSSDDAPCESTSVSTESPQPTNGPSSKCTSSCAPSPSATADVHTELRACMNTPASAAPSCAWTQPNYHVSTTLRAIPEPASTKQGRRPGSAKSLHSKRASRTLLASEVRLSSFTQNQLLGRRQPLNRPRLVPLE